MVYTWIGEILHCLSCGISTININCLMMRCLTSMHKHIIWSYWWFSCSILEPLRSMDCVAKFLWRKRTSCKLCYRIIISHANFSIILICLSIFTVFMKLNVYLLWTDILIEFNLTIGVRQEGIVDVPHIEIKMLGHLICFLESFSKNALFYLFKVKASSIIFLI